MSKAEEFIEWAQSNGAIVEVIQEDDSSGFTVMRVLNTGGSELEVTVNE